jgi:hypothetical protein
MISAATPADIPGYWRNGCRRAAPHASAAPPPPDGSTPQASAANAPPFTFLTARFAFGLLCLLPVVLLWKPQVLQA